MSKDKAEERQPKPGALDEFRVRMAALHAPELAKRWAKFDADVIRFAMEAAAIRRNP